MGSPLGISVSDLTLAIKLARQFYEKCCNEETSSYPKYQRFINDVGLLGQSLHRLRDVVDEKYERQRLQNEYRRMQLEPGPGADNSRRLWVQLYGDFITTLQECNNLIDRHQYLRTGQNTVSSNLRFWLSAESTVDNLMARLKFHITKVEFYLKPSELDGAIKNGMEIQELRRQVAKLERLMMYGPEQSRDIRAEICSTELATRFRLEIQTNGPSWLEKESEWSLNKAFDALAIHFAAGTIKLHPSSDTGGEPGKVAVLELAKSIWISSEIQNSSLFQAVGMDSIWSDRMRQFDDDLRSQLHRFEIGELEIPHPDELLELSGKFYIFNGGRGKDSDPLSAGEAGPIEEKILQLGLPSETANRESDLLVFRESDYDFRLVTSTKQSDTLMAQYDREVELNMDRHRLVPAYGSPDQGLVPRYNLLLYNERGKKPKEFVCQSRADIFKLQRALTGYRVHHDMPVAHWCINGSEEQADHGRGIVQLWQFKPLPPIVDCTRSTSDANSSMRSPVSPFELPGSVPQSAESTAPAPSSATYSGRSTGREPVDRVDWSSFSSSPFIQPSSAKGHRASIVDEGSRRWSSLSSNMRRDSSTSTSTKNLSSSRNQSIAATSVTGSRELQRHPSASSVTTFMTHESITSAVRGSQSNGTQFLKPEPPVLVIFTQCNDRYSFIHLTLEEKIFINPNACGCRKAQRHCNRVVFERKKGAFAVRTLKSEGVGSGGLDSWDLAAFRFPRPEKFKKTSLNEKVKTLELQFTDEAEKNEFVRELTQLENVRAAGQYEYEKCFRDKKKRART